MISIIVAIYNVQDYLIKCINSIINQTYRELEIILVDDGSSDLSGKICDEFADGDKRIRVIHKKNGGLSDARNIGLQAAQGEYIGFVDGDDYVELDMYKIMYNFLQKSKSDICCCGRYSDIYNANLKTKSSVKRFYLEKPLQMSNEEAILHFLKMDFFDASVCDKLFSRNVLCNIRFPQGKLYEDMMTTYALIKKSIQIVHIGECKYHYLMREGSITQSKMTHRNVDCCLFAKFIYNDIKINYPQLSYWGIVYYGKYLDYFLKKIQAQNQQKSFNYNYSWIQKDYRAVFRTLIGEGSIPLKTKIGSLLVAFGMYGRIKAIGYYYKSTINFLGRKNETFYSKN